MAAELDTEGAEPVPMVKKGIQLPAQDEDISMATLAEQIAQPELTGFVVELMLPILTVLYGDPLDELCGTRALVENVKGVVTGFKRLLANVLRLLMVLVSVVMVPLRVLTVLWSPVTVSVRVVWLVFKLL